MNNEDWINMFINKYNESKDYKITDVRDREKLLDELRPTGEWYFSCEKGWECNKCHEVIKEMPTCMRKPLFNFCPNCGADMRKETKNEDD